MDTESPPAETIIASSLALARGVSERKEAEASGDEANGESSTTLRLPKEGNFCGGVGNCGGGGCFDGLGGGGGFDGLGGGGGIDGLGGGGGIADGGALADVTADADVGDGVRRDAGIEGTGGCCGDDSSGG